jgi:hypothetical protein
LSTAARHRLHKISTTDGLCLGAHARNQDVDQAFGGPLTIGAQAYVRNKRAQQVVRPGAHAGRFPVSDDAVDYGVEATIHNRLLDVDIRPASCSRDRV